MGFKEGREKKKKKSKQNMHNEEPWMWRTKFKTSDHHEYQKLQIKKIRPVFLIN